MGNFVRTRTHTRETRTYSHRYGLGTGFFTGFLQVIFFSQVSFYLAGTVGVTSN
jgi:hypothetical protein